MKRHLSIFALLLATIGNAAAQTVPALPSTMILSGTLAQSSGFQPSSGDVVSAVNTATNETIATGAYNAGSYSVMVSAPNGTQIALRIMHAGSTYNLRKADGSDAIVTVSGSIFPVQTTLNLSSPAVTPGTIPATALTSTNSIGNTHGIQIYDNRTTLSGGMHSTSLTLDDAGATFANVQTGAPVRVMGVADGVGAFDAVNLHQLTEVKRGIAATNAIANIPQGEIGKAFSLGVGLGGYDGQTAVAVGASWRVMPSATVKASVGGVNGSKASYGIGAAISW